MRKGERVRKYPFCVAGQYVGPWFIGSVCEASSSVFFSDGFQVESVAVMWERSTSAAGSWLSDRRHTKKKGVENSSWEEEGINALCLLIGLWVTDSLGGGIDSRKEIVLWLQQKNTENDFLKMVVNHSELIQLLLARKIGLVWFSFMAYFKPNTVYTYILNI